MRISSISGQSTRNLAWALALVCVLAAGIALGRWAVPDSGSTALSGRPAASAPIFSVPYAEVPVDSGHVIGMTFEAWAPLESGDPTNAVSPDSPGEGHIIGLRFR